jgi:uncharacterized protein YegL
MNIEGFTAADIIIALDESGSMEIMGKEPIQAINSFLEEQKKIDSCSLLSIYTFNNYVNTKVKNIALKDFQEFKDYSPSGTTALYDAINTSIQDNKEKTNVVFVIVTDGKDNSSKIVLSEIKEKIKNQQEQYNWQILYLAANQDAFEAGCSMNIRNSSSYVQSPNSFTQTLQNVSSTISNYRRLSKYIDKPII